MLILKKFFKARAERSNQRQFEQGYNYAAGMLLANFHQSELIIEKLRIEADNPFDFDRSPFDHGIDAAVEAFQCQTRFMQAIK